MDFKVLLLSHGKLCEEMLNSAKMITDELHDVYAIPLLMDDQPEEYQARINAAVEQIEGEFIVITDVFGGTPYKTALMLLGKYDTYVLSGMCLGMVIEIPFARDEGETLLDAARHLDEIAKTACRTLNRQAFLEHKDSLF